MYLCLSNKSGQVSVNFKTSQSSLSSHCTDSHKSLLSSYQQCSLMFNSKLAAIYITSAEIIRDADGKSTVDTAQYPGSLGITYELCSGIVDKDVSLAEIAKLEVLEECGYDIPVSSLEKVTSFK